VHTTNDDTMVDARIRNNTVYYPSGKTGYGISSQAEGTGHVIANNIVWFADGSGTCFQTPLAQSAYAFAGNNLCNGTWGTSYDLTTHLASDPRFTNAPDDLSLQDGSPALGKGSSTYGASVDFTGAARPNPPSIGAYE
jgi:hypothetical protein